MKCDKCGDQVTVYKVAMWQWIYYFVVYLVMLWFIIPPINSTESMMIAYCFWAIATVFYIAGLALFIHRGKQRLDMLNSGK